MTLTGVAMLLLPGPAFIVIPIGLAILAAEFRWARRWLSKLRLGMLIKHPPRESEGLEQSNSPATPVASNQHASDADERVKPPDGA